MKRFSILCGVFVIISCASGCIGPPGITQPRAMITGVLLRPGEDIATKQMVRMNIKFRKDGWNKSYRALMGPTPFLPAPPDAVGSYHNTSPTWYLKSGWVFLCGDWPLAETDEVTAEGTGTTIIAQIDGNIHRIYLIYKKGHDSCLVQHKTNLTARQQLSIGGAHEFREDMYVDVDATLDTITLPKRVSEAGSDIQLFAAYVKARAGDAEIFAVE